MFTALTLDVTGSVLYAAGTGVVYAIDVGYGDKTFGQVIARLGVTGTKTDSGGYISTIALNADSTRLFVGTPGSRLFAGTNNIVGSGGSDLSTISVFDVDPADFNSKTTGVYFDRQLGAPLYVGLDIWNIEATADPLRMVFTTRGSINTGFNTLTIVNTTLKTFKVIDETTPLSLAINAATIGSTHYGFGGGLTGLPLSDQYRRGDQPVFRPQQP